MAGKLLHVPGDITLMALVCVSVAVMEDPVVLLNDGEPSRSVHWKVPLPPVAVKVAVPPLPQ